MFNPLELAFAMPVDLDEIQAHSIHDEEVALMREATLEPVSPWVRRALANELPAKELSIEPSI